MPPQDLHKGIHAEPQPSTPQSITEPSRAKKSSRRRSNGVVYLLAFVVLFPIWLLLSGKFDVFHLALGVISCGITAVYSGDLLFSSPKRKGLFTVWIRFIKYIPWLVYQVFVANLHVLYLVFHPRMMELIDPRIIRFDSRLKSDMARVTFANSITLTPGTITVNVSIFGQFAVHAIDVPSAEALPGEMEQRVAEIFGE